MKHTREYGNVLDWEDMCEDYNDDVVGQHYKGCGRPACGDCVHGIDTCWDNDSFQFCEVKQKLVIRYTKPCADFAQGPRQAKMILYT